MNHVKLKLTRLTPRRGVYLILIIGLLSLLPTLLQKGLASAYHFKSRFYIDQWQSGKDIDRIQYSNALLAADYATNIDSNNPHYLLTQAKVMEWGVYSGLEPVNTVSFNQLYFRAIELRKVWPNAYSDYAYNLAFFQKDLDKSWHYLLLAYQYGPYSEDVISQTLAIGLSYWQDLNVLQKQHLLQMSLVAVEANWRLKIELEKLSSQYQLNSVLCRYFKYQKKPLNNNTVEWLNRSICRLHLIPEENSSEEPS